MQTDCIKQGFYRCLRINSSVDHTLVCLMKIVIGAPTLGLMSTDLLYKVELWIELEKWEL